MTRLALILLALVALAPGASAQRARTPWSTIALDKSGKAIPRTPTIQSTARGGMPTWVKWGLVGAGVGAVAGPLLAGMASDESHNVAKEALGGAFVGFVVVGGSVKLWQTVCGEGSSSRRAGMCGR